MPAYEQSAVAAGMAGPCLAAPIAYFGFGVSWAWVFLPPAWWMGVGIIWGVVGVSFGAWTSISPP
jgi:hypothetical protein